MKKIFNHPYILIVIAGFSLWSLFAFIDNKDSIWNEISDLYLNPICKNCNILLISLDTLSSNHLPCYGYTRNTAQELCAFGNENILYTNSYAQTYWTLPSHFSIFTSLYPSTHNMLELYKQKLNPAYKTLPEVLQKNGYNTEYFGFTLDAGLPFNKGLERGFNTLNGQGNFSQNDWNNAIDKFILDTKKGKSFSFIHSWFVHLPYFHENTPPLRFTDKFYPELNINFDTLDTDEEAMRKYYAFLENYIFENKIIESISSKKIKDIYDLFVTATTMIDKKIYYKQLISIDKRFDGEFEYFVSIYSGKEEYVRALYDERIYNLDKILFTALARIPKEIMNKTIIVITADHGEAFKEHGTFSHKNLYNEVSRVPLILSVPGVKNLKINSLIQGIDIYPTLLDFVGISYDQSKIEGKSMSCLGKCSNQQKHPYIISEMYDEDGRSITLTDQNMKLYVHNIEGTNSAVKKIELFDEILDQGEKNDISQQKKDIVDKKMNEVKRFVNRNQNKFSITQMPTLSPNEIDTERKEKLNYFHY